MVRDFGERSGQGLLARPRDRGDAAGGDRNGTLLQEQGNER